jgi:putative flippase GtrA
MNAWVNKIVQEHTVLRYLISGAIATIVHLSILYLLTEYIILWYMWSASIAFIFGILTSFSLQKWWTYTEKTLTTIPTQATLYLLITVCGMIANSFLLYILVEFLDFWYIFGQIIVSALMAIINFFAYQYIFRV